MRARTQVPDFGVRQDSLSDVIVDRMGSGGGGGGAVASGLWAEDGPSPLSPEVVLDSEGSVVFVVSVVSLSRLVEAAELFVDFWLLEDLDSAGAGSGFGATTWLRNADIGFFFSSPS